MFVVNGILFNHESERWGETFVTRKITRAAGRIKMGLQKKLYLGTLEAKRDWGYAPDYVEAMWLMLQQPEPDDYVIATGEAHSVREFLEKAFGLLGLDPYEYMEIDPRYFRPTDGRVPGTGSPGAHPGGRRTHHYLARRGGAWINKRKSMSPGIGGWSAALWCASCRPKVIKNLVLRRHELDLRNQAAVEAFFARERPEYVFLAAAKVGGILANATYPADFIRDNRLIQSHVIDAAYRYGVKKLLFLGTCCIYPKFAPQLIKEEHFLTGPVEPTNEPYTIAKIAGIKMVQAYRWQYGFSAISLMPTNLYGSGDNFDLQTSHVLPALIRKFYEAKERGDAEVVVWGTGKPCRAFLHVDDLADAVVFLMRHYDEDEIINVGVGKDISIAELAALIAEVVGFRGKIIYDTGKPDSTPRKLLGVSRLFALGWRPKIGLREGVEQIYRWFLAHQEQVRG